MPERDGMMFLNCGLVMISSLPVISKTGMQTTLRAGALARLARMLPGQKHEAFQDLTEPARLSRHKRLTSFQPP